MTGMQAQRFVLHNPINKILKKLQKTEMTPKNMFFGSKLFGKTQKKSSNFFSEKTQFTMA
jgi:hypothetical protein